MSKLEFANSSLSARVIPSIDNTIESLNDVVNASYRMDIPSGFRYANELRNYKSQVASIRKDFQNIKSWLNNSNRSLDTNIHNMTSRVYNIKDVDITLRRSSLG